MRLTQSFHRPETKICRCAASWPRKAIWTMITASTAPEASCHQEFPIQRKVTTQATRTTTAPISLAQ